MGIGISGAVPMDILKNTPQAAPTGKGAAFASIIGAIPSKVWTACIVLLGSLIALALYFHHSSEELHAFTDGMLSWLLYLIGVGTFAFTVSFLFKVYKTGHTVITTSQERLLATTKLQKAQLLVQAQKLKNQQLEVKIAFERELPLVLKYALEAGHNVEYTTDGLRVQNHLSNLHTLGTQQLIAEQITVEDDTDYVPEPYSFSSVLQYWRPSKDAIMLAKKEELITVSTGEGLCHTIFTGNTDSGKTNDERMLLIQLLAVGETVFLCDRNYAPLRKDKKSGEIYDYRPIEAQLAYPAIDTASEAVQLTSWLIAELNDRRMKRREAGNRGEILEFADLYLFIDELPAFCSEEPTIIEHVGRLLRESRQYGIFFVGAAQDILNATLNADSGSYRDNLLTDYYGGGDLTTARKTMNLQKGESLNEVGLGKKGLKYLRAKGADLEHTRVRTPLADNDATLTLLSDLPPRTRLMTSITRHPSLPVMLTTGLGLTEEQEAVYSICLDSEVKGGNVSDRKVASELGIGKTKANQLLDTLEEKNLIQPRRGRRRIDEE
jgi:hypothetical protein